MAEAGLLKYGQTSIGYYIKGITWEGHEFLDMSRNSIVWEKTKSTFIDKGIGWTFEFAKTLMTRFNLEALTDVIQ